MRPATTWDAGAIGAIHAASWRAAYRGILPDEYLGALHAGALGARWMAALRRRLRLEETSVAEVEGRVAGFVSFQPIQDAAWLGMAGEVTMLYLAPEHVGRGVGRALFGAALDAIAARPAYWAEVWVLAANERARRFYERAGLRLDGARRVDRFGATRVDVVRYAKALHPVLDLAALARER